MFNSDKIRNISCDYNSRYPEGYLEVELAPIPECQPSCQQQRKWKYYYHKIDTKKSYAYTDISEEFCKMVPKIERSCICNKGYIRHSRDWTCVPKGFCHWTNFVTMESTGS